MPVSIIFCTLLILGFLYRLYFSHLAVTTLLWDMEVYDGWAKDFLAGRFPIDCCLKNVGYSAFLAAIYTVFGSGNTVAVRLVQVLLDTTTAVLVFSITKKLGGTKAAWWAFALYLFNPFIPSFTGFILSEIWSIFLLTVFLFVINGKNFSGKRLKGASVQWLSCGILLGLLLFTRHSMQLLVMAAIVFFAGFTILPGRKILFLIVCCAGFLLASGYSLVRYGQEFGKIAIVPPYGMKVVVLYTTFFGGKYPELDFYVVHPEFARLAIEYSNTPVPERALWSDRIMKQFWQKMKTDWPVFLRNYVQRIFWIWDKDHLFIYHDPFYPGDVWPVRILNLFLFLSGIGGIIRYAWIHTWAALAQPVFSTTLALFISITVFFPLYSSESRHSLVFYGLLCIWGGYGIARLFRSVVK